MSSVRVLLIVAIVNLLGVGSAFAFVDALRSAVVRIEVIKLVARKTGAGNYKTTAEPWIGSGFWVAGTNRIVTCAHVLDGAQQIDISPYSAQLGAKSWSTKRGQVSVCLSDPNHDLAIVQVPEVGTGLLLATTIHEQIAITAVGHTEGYPWRINEGKLTGQISAHQLQISRVTGDVLVCDVSIGPGSSGGIVVDRENHVLGMIEGGKDGGKYGTRIAIPSTVIRQTLQALPDRPCHGGFSAARAVIADEDTYADLISGALAQPDLPARLWGDISYGHLTGIDRFDDQLPALRLDAVRVASNSLSWIVGAEWGHAKVQRALLSGSLEIADNAAMSRLSFTGGPRLRLKEFGRVAVYSAVRAGYVHDQIKHDYTFASPLFAPQSYDRPISGALGVLSADAEVMVITNLRLVLSGEMWQGSGGIGDGVTSRIGLRAGVGRGQM